MEELSFGSRLKHAWNAFTNRSPTARPFDPVVGYTYRPDRPRFTRGNERSIVTSVLNRIALDVSAINIKHCKLDNEGRFLSVMDSKLNNCLNIEANLDQTSRAFMMDAIMSMLDEGCVALVPVDTTFDPNETGAYDILSMRTGRILEWYPDKVRVKVYNEKTGLKQDVTLSKRMVSIVENPLFSVMNEPNSTMQRLVRKLNLLDAIDEQSGSGKLDLIIQLPYTIKSPARRQQAEDRRKDIEMQLTGSKYGIAYTDSTEHITQLNRPAENNLMKQIEYLTSMLYSQLGITQSILDGTADEATMLNYYSRTVEPIVAALVDEMKRKFLTKTARSQNQSILYFRDPFKLVPVKELAELADKFTRNEIMTSNEIRQIVGMKPSNDPKADMLINSNINHPDEGASENGMSVDGEEDLTEEDYRQALADLDDLDSQLDELEQELGHRDKEELKHYASPYYDPVKAHEYYMRTRELKGRKSTAGLNEEGKSAAKYVKEQLNNERKTKVETHKSETNTQIETLRDQKKATIEAHKSQMQSKIDSLRSQLKSMSKAQKEAKKEQIYSEIDSLRAANKEERQRLSEEYKASTTELRSEHKAEKTRLKEEYDEKYIQELDKIKADSKFKK